MKGASVGDLGSARFGVVGFSAGVGADRQRGGERREEGGGSVSRWGGESRSAGEIEGGSRRSGAGVSGVGRSASGVCVTPEP